MPISEESHYRLDPKRAMEYVDENTIGVYVILGSMYRINLKLFVASLINFNKARTPDITSP